MKTHVFGGFSFSSANGITVSSADELSGAKRTIALAKLAGGRGTTILRTQEMEKVVEIEGVIEGVDADGLIDNIRNLEQNLLAESSNGQADLTITNSKGTFVYEDVAVMNMDTIVNKEEHYNVRWVPFRVQFLCSKGFARSSTQTTHSVADITAVPYDGSITVDGNTSPQPLLKFTFDTASTITDITFTNTTTNESITVSGLTLANGDVLEIDAELGQVRLNTVVKSFTGVIPTFLPGLNNYQITVSGSSNISESQTSYNAEHSIYGNRQISQKFTVNGTGDRTQVGLLLKKIVEQQEVLYQNFSSDYSGFSVSGGGPGEIYVSGGTFHLDSEPGQGTLTATQNASLSSAGDGIRFTCSVAQGGNTGNANAGYVEFTDGTDYIRVRSSLDSSNQMNSIISTSAYGSLNISISGNGELKIQQVGSDIKVYWQGTLKATISNTTLKANSYVKYVVIPGSNAPNHMTLDNVYRLIDANQNGDITVRIETDSSGEPSGTLADVPDSTLTIPSSVVATGAFSEIIKEFSTNPSLTDATTLHLVVSQAGGDVNNYYLIKKNTAGGYAGGNILTTEDGGTNWTDVAGEDLYFKIWSSLPTAFNIDHDNLYYPSYLSAG